LKKLLSFTSAVILGLVIMLLPIMILTPESTDQPEVFSMDLTGRLSTAQTLGESDVGAVPFPSSMIYVGALTLVGVLIASATYVYVKKRTALSLIEA
jgi:hypothetical protein